MRLFVYGTLTDPALMARFAGRPVPLTPATLRGWRRVALPRGQYPTLRRAPGAVEGFVASVDPRTLKRLVDYEGPVYRLTRVTAHTTRGAQSARAWIAPSGVWREWLAKRERDTA